MHNPESHSSLFVYFKKLTTEMKVEIISKDLIKPSSPTPPNLQIYRLSSLDQILPPYVPLILYYSYNEATDLTQSDMSFQLKKSLSETLTHFYPLAGRLTEDRRSIDCNDRVYYAEARVDFLLSNVIEDPNIEELSELVPCKLAEFGSQIIEEQLAIQVNWFQCGGIAVGLCISHRIADAFSFCTFIKAWANTTKGDGDSVLPVFNLAYLFPPQDLPDHGPKTRKSAAQHPQPPPRPKLVTKRFVFTASTIAALKAKVVNSFAGLKNIPTRVEVVTALIWKCAIAVPGLSKLGKSVAFHIVNLRGRMVQQPPLEGHSFGNFFQVAGTSPVTNEEAADLACLTGKLRSALRELDCVYTRKLLGENGQQLVSDNIRRSGILLSRGDVEMLNFSSWCRFPCYEADIFGWGKPSWVSSVHFGSRNGVFLIDSINGGIEVWVTMNEQDMIQFEKNPEHQSFIVRP